MEKNLFQQIQVVDLNDVLHGSPAKARGAAVTALESLIATSALIVRDPRISDDDSAATRAVLTEYFSQPRALFLPDVRKEYDHQVGLSIEGAETGNKNAFSGIDRLAREHRPHIS